MIDENNQVLAGHGRLAAARQMFLPKVPCRRLVGMTPAENKAYIIADNRLSLDAGWDSELLAESLGELNAIDFDLSLTGFEGGELDSLFAKDAAQSPKKSKASEDDIPSVADDEPFVSKTGDMWLMGRHKLVCGDALDDTVLSTLMDGQKADLIFTDPPYNVPINGHVSGLGKTQHPEFAMASGEMSSAEFSQFLARALGNGAAHCRNGAIAFVCMDWRHIGDLIAVGAAVFSELKNLCVWDKTNAGMGTFYRSKHELVAVFKVGDAAHTNTFGLGDKGRYRTNVWSYAGVNSFSSERMEQLASHPTVKPVALVADAIRDVSHRGEIVLDMFGGSGTTLIAAQNTGRIARMAEISPRYCDVIVQRWQRLTGKAAIHATTKLSFEEVQNG